MPRQVGIFQQAVITGTTGGVTGGTIVPAGSVGAIWNVEHAEVSNTGQNVNVRGNPSLKPVDVKQLAAFGNITPSPGPVPKAVLPAGDAIQVITSAANVVVKVVYTVEDPTGFL